MKVLTVNVGQGSLAIVRHNSEAIIIDSRIPPANDDTVTFVKGMFSVALKDHNVKGLILTGFDADHADTTGVALVLKKYRPDWVMYPKYYKDTAEAKAVFKLIAEQVEERANTSRPLKRHSVRLDRVDSRNLKSLGLSENFDFELFSPHIEDMDSSNNCSIVIKVTGRGAGGFSYLVTGDTEVGRWESIAKLFGANLKSQMMAAAHHGSKNGVHPESLMHIDPHTIHISAGVDNQYGHPHSQAVEVYGRVAKRVHATNVQGGVSLLTQAGAKELETTLIPSA
jgi:beta-lactamase superfamily II metal-dependent hydrolase